MSTNGSALIFLIQIFDVASSKLCTRSEVNVSICPRIVNNLLPNTQLRRFATEAISIISDVNSDRTPLDKALHLRFGMSYRNRTNILSFNCQLVVLLLRTESVNALIEILAVYIQ